jgi:perosamine synthetase
MLTTNSKTFYEKMLCLRNLSFGKKDRFNHEDIGWNYRMTNIQATLGLSQLNRIKKIVRIKHRIGARYYKHLSKNKNLYIPEPNKDYANNIYWVIGILITNKKLKLDAIKVMKKMEKFRIGTRPFFWPMHKQKIFKFLKKKTILINS